MINSEQVGKRIASFRRAKKLSQEQLAEQLNVSAQAVSKWETGKTLPETANLPQLSRVLGYSIDHILQPQELIVLQAIYTDGQAEQDVTHFVNQFITGSTLSLTVSELTFPQSIQSERLKLLLIKYETPSGIRSAYALNGQSLTLDVHSKGYPASNSGLDIVYAAYGNERANVNVQKKLKHYAFFQWKHFTASHELFPSLIDNSGNDYLLLVYLNAEGIHAVSCAEGEQIHYSADGTRLFQSHSPLKKYIVEGVDRLGFGRGMDCSWAGALYSSLTARGIDTTYEQIMGVSGACWRIAFTPLWDYSSADALVAYDYSAPACTALGLTDSWADRLQPEERQSAKHRIMDSIRKHELPIAINLRVAPEWGVITGYMDDGSTLLCRSYFDDETYSDLQDNSEFLDDMKISKGYLYVDHWPYRLVHFSSQENQPSARDNLYASLRVKIESINTAEHNGYWLGYKAIEGWSDSLLEHAWYMSADDEAFGRRMGVNHFCMMALADARRSAAVYLTESLPLLNHPLAYQALSELTGVYGQISALLAELYGSMTDPASLPDSTSLKQLWTAEQRERQAGQLQLLAALERQGDELAQVVLENREH